VVIASPIITEQIPNSPLSPNLNFLYPNLPNSGTANLKYAYIRILVIITPTKSAIKNLLLKILYLNIAKIVNKIITLIIICLNLYLSILTDYASWHYVFVWC